MIASSVVIVLAWGIVLSGIDGPRPAWEYAYLTCATAALYLLRVACWVVERRERR